MKQQDYSASGTGRISGTPPQGSRPSARSQIYYWKSDRPAFLEGASKRRRDGAEMTRMIQEELEREFPWKKVSLKPSTSQGNHVIYFATIGDLNGFVRIEDGSDGGDYLELETRIMRLLHGNGIPTPEVYALDASRSQVPFAWQVLEYVQESDLMRLHKDDRLKLNEVAHEIGCNIAKWQSFHTVGYGPFKEASGANGDPFAGYHQSYADYFYLHLERHVAYLQEHAFFSNETAAEVLGAFEANRSRGLLNLEQSCLVHKDLALWNILGTSEGISAFIDWEDAIGGDPMDDFSLLGCFHSGAVVAQALDGYARVRSLPADYRQRFWLHLLRNMLVKAVIRIGAGYFQKTDDLFLIDAGATGSDLKSFTQQRIQAALRGLRDDREISEL